MNTKKTLAMLITLAGLQAFELQAQDEMFLLGFRGTLRPGLGDDSSTSINRGDLIRRCVGEDLTRRQLNRNFALVYNATADSIQVVNRSDGSVVCTLFHFEGGTVSPNQTGNGTRLVRFTFVFNDSQAEAVGTAVITERPPNNANRARLHGRMQVTFGNEGGTNTSTPAEVTSGFVQKNARAATTGERVLTATFNAGRPFRATGFTEETVPEEIVPPAEETPGGGNQVTNNVPGVTNNVPGVTNNVPGGTNNVGNQTNNTRQAIIDAFTRINR